MTACFAVRSHSKGVPAKTGPSSAQSACSIADVFATCSKLRDRLEAGGTGVSAAPRVFESFLCRVGLCCLALFT